MQRIKKALKKTLVRMQLHASPDTCYVLETVLESKRVPRLVGYNTILTSSTISELKVSSVCVTYVFHTHVYDQKYLYLYMYIYMHICMYIYFYMYIYV
jgi:hypothetical protein